MRIISYGGGVQSTALCVLAVQGKIGHVDAALFANVGDDSEHPSTITYVREVMIPWCAEHGLDVHELKRRTRDGSIETLWSRITKPGSQSLTIPMRMSETGKPNPRSCTSDFKVRVIAKWLKARGISNTNPAGVLIGYSTDEAIRMTNMRPGAYEQPEFPLLDLRLSRTDCKALISRAGLAVPPKSACFFCPFHRPSVWSRMRRDEPELFAKSVELERQINTRKGLRSPMYLTRFGVPLDEAVEKRQPDLPLDAPGGESCDDGYCWT